MWYVKRSTFNILYQTKILSFNDPRRHVYGMERMKRITIVLSTTRHLTLTDLFLFLQPMFTCPFQVLKVWTIRIFFMIKVSNVFLESKNEKNVKNQRC